MPSNVDLKKPWGEGLSKMERFVYSQTNSNIGFQNYVNLDLFKTIEEQLKLRDMVIRKHLQDPENHRAIRAYIEKNSSLRIGFGFSFESESMFRQMMTECVDEVMPKYNIAVGSLTGDTRCDWFGFMPLNIFEKAAIEDLSLEGLIQYNNELIKFQYEIVKFVFNHKLFRQHSIVRNNEYRFKYFKSLRHKEAELVDAFWFYLDSIKETSLCSVIPRDIIEVQVGCHFLYNPDKFFEILEFIKLKGELYE